MHKNNKKGDPNMSEGCCTTSCDIREGSSFQSSEKQQWCVAENFLRISLGSPKLTNFYQINLFHASFSGK